MSCPVAVPHSFPITHSLFSSNHLDRECAHILQANLLEITDLGKTFKGAGIRNLSQLSATTSGEMIAYNKLLGHQDGIIADIVRREGLVSRQVVVGLVLEEMAGTVTE